MIGEYELLYVANDCQLTNETTSSNEATISDGRGQRYSVLRWDDSYKIFYWDESTKSFYFLIEDKLEQLKDGKRSTVFKFPNSPRNFSINQQSEQIAWEEFDNGRSNLNITNLSTGETKSFGRLGDTMWSTDGKILLCTVWTGKKWNCALLSDGKQNLLDIPTHRSGFVKQTFSPDEKQISFGMKGKDGTLQIGIADINGLKVRQITDNGKMNTLPSFSPDGNYLAYIWFRADGKYELAVFDLTIGKESVLAPDVKYHKPLWRRRVE